MHKARMIKKTIRLKITWSHIPWSVTAAVGSICCNQLCIGNQMASKKTKSITGCHSINFLPAAPGRSGISGNNRIGLNDFKGMIVFISIRFKE